MKNNEFEKPKQKLELEFTSKDETNEFVHETEALVDILATELSVDPVELVVPENGFLKSALTLDQKKQLDQDLGPVYATESVRFQDEVMKEKILECGERMVSLVECFRNEGLNIYFSSKPYHAACGEWAGKSRVYWVREQVAQKLVGAVKALSSIGLTLFIQDAFRPVGVQEGLFRRRIVDYILPQHPNWTWEQILLEARSKTGINPRLSGHKGGASIDANLCTTDGKLLPLGNEYPEGGALVALNFPFLTTEEWRTRQLFSAIMQMVGLVPYPGEDWHASFGDNLAIKSIGGEQQAIYGPIKGFNAETGEIVPYSPEEYDQPFYSEEELRAIAKII